MKSVPASFRVFSPQPCVECTQRVLHHTCQRQEESETSMNCPNCKSDRTVLREAGRKTGGAVGAAAGAAAGAISAMRGAQIGAAGGIVLGPLGAVVGGLGGAVAAILLGGSAGGAIGSAVGSAADESFLDNRSCLACGLTFRDDSEDGYPHGDAQGLSRPEGSA